MDYVRDETKVKCLLHFLCLSHLVDGSTFKMRKGGEKEGMMEGEKDFFNLF
jgi:hypothetical protein